MLAFAMYRLLFAMCSVYASLQLCSADNNEELEEGTLMHCLKTCTPGMFTGFWVIGFDFFRSDPNINSDPISFNRTR